MSIPPPRDPGPAGWEAILAPRQPAPALRGEQRADVLIVGAGFAGLSAARRLMQLRPDWRIAVLEAVAVAQGPAGRNSGFMIDLPHDLQSADYAGAIERDRAQIERNRGAIAFARAAAAELRMPPAAARSGGKVNAAAGPAGERRNRDYAGHLARLEEPHRWLDAAQMRALTGTEHYRSGLHTPGTLMLQPALYIRALADGLRAGGCALHEHSPVQRFERRRGDWCAKTPAGCLRAPRALLAVNGHLQHFGHCRGRLLHLFTYASMSAALTPAQAAQLGGEHDWSLLPAHPMGATVRRVDGPEGPRIVVRSRFSCEPSMAISSDRLQRLAGAHRHGFATRFPALAECPFDFVWGGRLCLSLDDSSVVGELAPGLFSACVQNGLGTARGTANGVRAAEMIGGARAPRAARAPARRLPPAPLLAFGANASLWWRTLGAGAER